MISNESCLLFIIASKNNKWVASCHMMCSLWTLNMQDRPQDRWRTKKTRSQSVPHYSHLSIEVHKIIIHTVEATCFRAQTYSMMSSYQHQIRKHCFVWLWSVWINSSFLPVIWKTCYKSILSGAIHGWSMHSSVTHSRIRHFLIWSSRATFVCALKSN